MCKLLPVTIRNAKPHAAPVFLRVDDADYPTLLLYNHYLTKTGYLISYSKIHSNGVKVATYTLLYGKGRVAYKNGSRLDLRRTNIRPVEKGDGSHPHRETVVRSGATATGLKGVYKQRSKRHPYYAMISIFGTTKYLGSFETLEAAGMAYDVAARTVHGDNAITNF